MNTVVIFVAAIVLPLLAGRLVWKRLNRPVREEEQPDSLGFLIKNLLIASATVLVGMWLGFSLI